MARDGDDVLGAEDIGLFENFAADFGEGEAVGGGIEVADELACAGVPLFVVRGNRGEVNIPTLSRSARQGWGTREIYTREIYTREIYTREIYTREIYTRRIGDPGLETAGVLDGLEGDAANAGLL